MKLHYVAQYIVPEKDGTEYSFSPPGTSKMNYFLRCFKELNIDTDILSLCLKKDKGLKKVKKITNQFGQTVRHIINFDIGGKFGKMLNLHFAKIQLLFYLMSVPKGDVVFFYHERFYSSVFKYIRRIKKYKIICDIEEIYTIHAKYSESKISEEIEYLKGFEYYTVSNDSLAEILEITKENYVLCCGVYSPLITSYNNTDSEITNVLYAGTFDSAKGGAKAAIESFLFLDHGYQLTVCGFGTESQINNICSLIRQVEKQNPEVKIEYRGYVPNTSQEYIDILSHTNIGLSTQNPDGDFNASSFPSKVFEYMRHGIRVVSTKIKGCSDLPIINGITFAKNNSASEIADAIKKARCVNLEEQDENLTIMHEQFKLDILQMICK